MSKQFQALLILLLHTFVAAEEIDLKKLPWIHAKDENAAQLIKPFLPKNPIIIEAGMHNANDTIRFKRVWPDATIYGFEPLPSYFDLSTKKAEHLDNVYVYNLALSDQIGKTQFYFSKKNPAASSLLKDNIANVNWPANKRKRRYLSYKDKPLIVETITIDAFIESEGIDKVDFIWLDTEGAELKILQSATSILPSVSVITTEVNFQEFRAGMTQFQDLYKFLLEQGFVLKYIWGNPKWQGIALFIHPENIKM